MAENRSEVNRNKMIKYEQKLFVIFEAGNLLLSNFGYVAIATSGYLFKLAMAATLASYFAFLSATVVGGFITYFPAMAIRAGLQYFNVKLPYAVMTGLLVQLGLAPVLGTWVVNAALGWNLSMAPMLAISGLGFAIGLAFVGYNLYNEYKENQGSLRPLPVNSRSKQGSLSSAHRQHSFDSDNGVDVGYGTRMPYPPALSVTGSSAHVSNSVFGQSAGAWASNSEIVDINRSRGRGLNLSSSDDEM